MAAVWLAGPLPIMQRRVRSGERAELLSAMAVKVVKAAAVGERFRAGVLNFLSRKASFDRRNVMGFWRFGGFKQISAASGLS